MAEGQSEYSAGKLFPINYQLLITFSSSIFSYLIVIIQFHLQHYIDLLNLQELS